MTRRKYNIAQPSFLGNEKKYLIDTIDSGWISSIGSYIERFENEFAAYHGMKHAVATHNGTIALHLALASCGIGEGDEVIVPDLTFVATANSVKYCHAEPVLTDVSLDDWNISPDEIRKSITPRTRAIIPVHLYGNPAKMDVIMSIAKEYNLLVIEDCAEALGSSMRGQRVGCFGQISCFSFFGNKIITTGEGGMCMTNDDELAERMRILRDHGMNRQKKYRYDHLGFNYRMTNMQAAVGLAQLEQLDHLLRERDIIYQLYKQNLRDQPRFLLQETYDSHNVNWIFTIRMKGISENQRDMIMLDMKDQLIDTRPVFYPIHQMPFYKKDVMDHGQFEATGTISGEGISLPTYIGLTADDIEHISKALLLSFEKIQA